MACLNSWVSPWLDDLIIIVKSIDDDERKAEIYFKVLMYDSPLTDGIVKKEIGAGGRRNKS